MKTVSLVGARPQFIKLAPVSRAMAAARESGGPAIEDIIVHTGQHYDPGLSDVFFSELEIPTPDVHMGVGSGSHGLQTARMLEGIERVLNDHAPDMLVVYGDTNSTVAGALAAAKLHVPIAHVEAGLRSFDRRMPEEVNRIVSDHISELLLAPTETAMANLKAENLADRARLVGDVMLDAVRFNTGLARRSSDILSRLTLEGEPFGIVTMHRASNTDSGRLRILLDTLNAIARNLIPLVFPVHPRTVSQIKSAHSDWNPVAGLRLIEPVGYLDMLRLMESARLVLTDSGGLQKEAFFLNVPCVTLRDETEWVETVSAGGNRIAGADPERILESAEAMLAAADAGVEYDAEQYFGDGKAAEAIVREIVGWNGKA
ncbi:MAG: UDP-N-acetylglucosamine 2-epimerase (non-hydrolyzing) [Woeseiaceae bacterium]|nr:UDP-N-acetylglucosamine 2-epimerase (non-hydrolyzing) [Woeseiaceae bacterium]